MKFISNYEEFGAHNGISVKDHVSEKEIPQKIYILNYLKRGESDGVQCHSVYDYIQNESKGNTVKNWTDGTYYWDDEEIYHFEKYNMELDPGFLEYMVDYYEKHIKAAMSASEEYFSTGVIKTKCPRCGGNLIINEYGNSYEIICTKENRVIDQFRGL